MGLIQLFTYSLWTSGVFISTYAVMHFGHLVFPLLQFCTSDRKDFFYLLLMTYDRKVFRMTGRIPNMNKINIVIPYL